ncbi:hypothetical protein [Streptosporangium sp. NPDC001681]|uniref:hypothetical protein n=1 Tax=Streptosporangium sp. NPDC001681 TaxID=3154395 RepID=UPI0033197D2C
MHIARIWDSELSYTATPLADQVTSRTQMSPPAADGAEPVWGVRMVLEGMEGSHSFPHSTLEWRAAEYGIDPDDVDTLLDVILHEPYMASPDDPLSWQDPATAAYLEATHGLPTCWTPGVGASDRLAAHLVRVAEVKRHRVLCEPEPREQRQAALLYVGSKRRATPDPLDPIKTGVRLDPIRVQARRMAVDWIRTGFDGPRLPSRALKPPSTFVGEPLRATSHE